MRQEFRPMLRMAAPLALKEVGWLAMGFVDTVMVGRLPESAVAIGAVSLGSTLFAATALVGGSVMLGLDTLIAQAFGGGKIEECHRKLWNALSLAIAMSPVLMVFGVVWLPLFHRVGSPDAVVIQTIPFVKALTWSTLPLSIYFVLRRYLQAMGVVKPVAFALVSANLINLLGNWIFVYGHFGFSAFGVAGSGWSTCVSRTYMVAVLALAAILHDRRRKTGLWTSSRRLELQRIRELLRLGLPAATQLLLEIGAFTAVTVLIGTLGAVPLAGHQIALNVASFTYMVPLGIGSAAAFRPGHPIGRRDGHPVARARVVGSPVSAPFLGGPG